MKNIGRNDPCSCGSGKKTKHCCKQLERARSPVAYTETESIPAAFQIALEHHRAGRLPAAEFIYQQIIHAEPNHSDALHLLGIIAHQAGKNKMAVELITEAIRTNPSVPLFYCNLGIVFKDLGKLEQAVASYRNALSIEPNFVFAHFSAGIVLKDLGNLDEAIASYRKAIILKPDYAEAHYNLGVALDVHGRLAEAMLSYSEAVWYRPNFAQAHFNMGVVLQHQGKLDEAVASYRKAVLFKPDYIEAHSNLGFVLNDQGKLDEAVITYHKAIAIQRESAEVYTNLGIVLVAQGKFDEAIASYRQALSFKPNLVEAHYILGCVLQHLCRWGEATASYHNALLFKPDYAEVYYAIGNMLHTLCRQDEAILSYHKAMSINPDYTEARLALMIACLPNIYSINQDPQTCRKTFSIELDQLENWFSPVRISNGFTAVGITLFKLAYQENDNRHLLSRFGALCHRLMLHWQHQQGYQTASPPAHPRIKVGIVSHDFHNHSVWHALIKGWVLHLDQSRFELHLIYLGTTQDSETEIAKSLATSFIEGKRSFAAWFETVLAQQLDIIIYPEIGMDPTAFQLASMRLAPVQVTAWGHPETSGLPTIDYFLSAADFEPDVSENHYTEKLVKLPNLGCCYARLGITHEAPNLERFEIDDSVPLLLCPGSPYKYAPQHDWIFPEIARSLGYCKLVFFSYHINEMSKVLQERLKFAFSNAGLDYDVYVVFIPWQPQSVFYGLMTRADVYLDTIGFSGFNTAMQAVECALPIVTREGLFMRGRFASGILKRMGLAELVTDSEEGYIALVVRLVRDSEYRQYVVERMKELRHLLFDDHKPIRALEDLLISVSKSQSRTKYFSNLS